eukprot:CAMPEP_0203891340 /NCGR_PEP_ID=MMETSP0359-20131031/34641_1 /ASSEMBLY_ACC=CAM_ASM_000338 /TAXON_ID=268821 /ORGANISM="Scrippsiella Hangoei, Strain SHTV-5" /LENGTH=31 /DNA_ID= /DNA_START= /DNA_END= /DNA_ORIENTATION=
MTVHAIRSTCVHKRSWKCGMESPTDYALSVA